MHRRSSGPSLTAGCIVRSARSVLRPPPTPFRHATHFPRSTVIGCDAPATISAGRWAGEGLPRSRRHYRHFRAPYAGEFLVAASRLFTASMAFTSIPRGSALPWPTLTGGGVTTPQDSLHATDRTVAPPSGPLTLGFHPARFQTKPPACYRASWQLPGPDSHRQAMTSLRTTRSAAHAASPPVLLGAREKAQCLFLNRGRR